MQSYDAVIVGGGPAGATCARSLTAAGLKVVVLDKSYFPRDKVCAGWITPQVVGTLQLDLDDYRRSRVLQPITAFVTGIGKHNATHVDYDHVVSYGIRRCEFDDYLLRHSGASLMLGESLKTIERQGTRWLINGSIHTPMIVGAGGHFCPVAQFLGASVGRDEPAITAQEIEFEMSETQARACGVAPETPELYFCDDLKGYAWCFRKGNFLNVGLGREDNHRLAEQLKSFWDWLVVQRQIPAQKIQGRSHPRFKGHAYLLRTRSPRAVIADGALLIGDAAGLAYPESGEGIRPAIESGIIAAQTIVAANEGYTRWRLRDYEEKLHARFGAGNTHSLSLCPAPLKAAVARSLLKTEWFARHIVLDRWFLHSRQPVMA